MCNPHPQQPMPEEKEELRVLLARALHDRGVLLETVKRVGVQAQYN
jgi:hypothetical protein